MCFIISFSGLKWLRKIWLRRGGCVIFLALLKIKWFSQMLGLDYNMLCFARRFFFLGTILIFGVSKGGIHDNLGDRSSPELPCLE